MALWAFLGDEHTRNSQLSSRLTDYMSAFWAKLDYVYNQCDALKVERLIKLGDVQTTLDTTIDAEVTNKYILLRRKHPNFEIDNIPGNHDIPGNDINKLYKTSTLTLALANAYKLLLQDERTNDIQIRVIDVDLQKSIDDLDAMQESDVPTVILGHHLFEWSLNPEGGLREEHFAKFATWKHPVTVFLGDDHDQYEPYRMQNVTIHRLGSLMRTKKPSTDTPWQPRFAIFNTETLEVDYHSIPCEDYATAFGTPNSKTKFQNLASLTKLQNAVERLGTIDYSDLTVSKVLKQLETPDTHMSYLRTVHEAVGENF